MTDHTSCPTCQMEAIRFTVRPIVDPETELWRQSKYEYALAQVRKDLNDSMDYWDPIMRQELPPLEEYHRLTKVQQARPDVQELTEMRGRVLAKAHHEGGWSRERLAAETGLPFEAVQRLIDRADA